MALQLEGGRVFCVLSPLATPKVPAANKAYLFCDLHTYSIKRYI